MVHKILLLNQTVASDLAGRSTNMVVLSHHNKYKPMPAKSVITRLISLFLFLVFVNVFLYGQDRTGQTLYKNPVMDENFPDPTAIRAPDGWFYVYATKTIIDDQYVNIQVARSEDLVSWEHLGDALPEKPVWAMQTNHFWAPHAHYDEELKTYFLYYSAYPDDGGGKCLAVATSGKPGGPFTDKGTPMLCGDSFINIDPMTFDDPETGKILMYWGSGFEPIKVRELTPDRLSFKPGTETYELVSPGEDIDYNILIEGAWVEYKDGYYYMYYSGDNCCGENANYAVMAARSKSPLGPFERFGEANKTGSSVILAKSERWLAPGHNSVITDDAGNEWMLYHAIDRENPAFDFDTHGRRVMMLDRIVYEDGWPRVKTGRPSDVFIPSPVIE